MRILLAVLPVIAFAQPKPVDFQREIRPILSNACYHCHGPDKATRMANLRLDVPGPAVMAGKPEQSKLWQRITHTNAALRMPPEQTHKVITAEQKSVIKRWIEEGGVYKSHWSFTAPARPAPPETAGDWARNPIDKFLLARMRSEGFQPAAEADKRTLARRLSFDLTGLPPAPADVEAFVKDAAEGAYERLVDKFMAMPQYGEHRARYWLDAARYGDTHGIHVDNYREMWAYREWVIQAFNRNQRFDQFTLEQLAGDLLPNPTIEQLVATGFHRCNITTNEGGSIEEEVAAVYAKDRVDTTGTVWMGLTVGCATCHDHKFDPIAQKEFYQMTAFFRNTTQKPMDGNIHDTPPVIVVPAERDRARWLAVQKEEQALRATRDAHKKAKHESFEKWVAAAKYKKFKEPLKGISPRFALAAPATLPEGVSKVEGSSPGTSALEFAKGKSLEFPGVKADLDSRRPFTLAAWVYLPKAEGDFVVASKTDLVEKKEDTILRGWLLDFDARRPRFQLHGGAKDDFLLIRTGQTVRLKAGAWHHIAVTFDGSRDYKGLSLFVNGKVQYTESNSSTGYGQVNGATLAAAPLKLAGEQGKRGFEGGRVHDLRIIDRELRDDEVELLAGSLALEQALAQGAAPTGAAKETLELAYLNRTDKAWQKISAQWLAAVSEQRDIARRSPVTHVMNEIKDKDPEAHVLFRGMYDQPRDKVAADVPSVLGGLPKDLPKNRLGLAKWLIQPEHPTMSRVTVNRFWQEIFGTGIVRSSEDFGAQGTPPTHPELLDWLAVEFRESGWDVKKLIKLMVTSAAYRQAAVATEDKRKKDPENLLLARGPRFRMDGEMVRDTALAASGLLVRHIGGPSVRPYQPNAIWETVAMLGSNTRFYKQDHGDKLYRRSMYTFWKRAAPPPSMDIFNAPSRENCTVKRERTNTPLQALVTMNDVQFVEAARNLAERALKNAKNDFDERLDYLSAHVLARSFDEKERGIVRAEYKDLLAHYDAKPAEAKKLISTGESAFDQKLSQAELAAWTMVANQVMNLDEALNK